MKWKTNMPAPFVGRNRAAQALVSEVFQRTQPSLARIGRNPRQRIGIGASVRTVRRRQKIHAKRIHRKRIPSLRKRGSAARPSPPVGLQSLRKPLHAGKSARSAHGFQRRGLRGLLPLPVGRSVLMEILCPTPPTTDRIQMGHGSGGRQTQKLIEEIFYPRLREPSPPGQTRCGRSLIEGARLAFTTDSFVIHPLFFPGATSADSRSPAH